MGEGGETHQVANSTTESLTTNQGVLVSDNQNSLTASPRGPVLIEDFVLREKITHFDHERIPERIVHARGSGAHGYFELHNPLDEYTTAAVLTNPQWKVPVFARFSTVAGGAGSADTVRDVRGFAVKFYTTEGNWDLVGNNVPVFFIQDAMKFPDLVHAVKMEPDRGFPQAASAHDTFWDFISLMPEATHMLMWAMSDRALPRSLRMMEGFGVHSFRLINAAGKSTFAKFHWRPRLGLQSLVWDEAVKIAGADPDFHRRDLWESIERGDFPEWEFAVQLFDDKQASQFPFDHLDPTKLIPEELVPLTPVGRLVLNQNPDNFFAETEQIAFCPANLVPGIDFSNDPLLQGRLFSYLDTQLSRLGGPNFHQLPINAPVCPLLNHQRDGQRQQQVPKGRVHYEPNSLAPMAARESLEGFRSYEPPRGRLIDQRGPEDGIKGRLRPASFTDHYSQAIQFYQSQTETEQSHIAAAFVFELSKVETVAIRERAVGNLRWVDEKLAKRVSAGLGLEKLPPKPVAAAEPIELKPSPSLSLIRKMREALTGRCVGVLIDTGSSAEIVNVLVAALRDWGACVKIISPKVGGATLDDGSRLSADSALGGTPSSFMDAIVVALAPAAAERLAQDATAIDFVRDAYAHLKAIAVDEGGRKLLLAANVVEDAGVLKASDVDGFLRAAAGRLWSREPRVRLLP